jgi:hypothetical protein
MMNLYNTIFIAYTFNPYPEIFDSVVEFLQNPFIHFSPSRYSDVMVLDLLVNIEELLGSRKDQT